MRISLKYGTDQWNLDLPDKRIKGILKPREIAVEKTEEEIVFEALDRPVSSPPLPKILKKGEEVTIVVCDKTRRCKTEIFLPILLERINACGIADEHITLIFANGTHNSHSEEERRALLGEEIFKRFKSVDHDPYANDNLAYQGTTKRGTPVFLNRLVCEVDKVIVCGGIVHHYFAGFGGGPKLINPGVAGYETICKNHSLSIAKEGATLHPRCQDGNLKGNPVYEDIVDSLNFCKPHFSLNVILDSNDRIVSAMAGDVVLAHRRGSEIANEIYRVSIKEQADLVIVSCGGYPKDINFIQTHKSIQHGFYSSKTNGVMIVLAQCPMGIGSNTFLEWFDYPDIHEMSAALRKNFKINGTTALALRTKAEKAKIILVSELEANASAKMGLIPAKSLSEAIGIAEGYLPKDYQVYIIPNGSLTVPMMP